MCTTTNTPQCRPPSGQRSLHAPCHRPCALLLIRRVTSANPLVDIVQNLFRKYFAQPASNFAFSPEGRDTTPLRKASQFVICLRGTKGGQSGASLEQAARSPIYRSCDGPWVNFFRPRYLIFLVDENICIFFKRIPPRPRLSVPVLLAGLRRGNECLRRQAGHACELRRKLRGRGERTGRFAKAHCEVLAPTSAYSYTQAPPRPGKILSIYIYRKGAVYRQPKSDRQQVGPSPTLRLSLSTPERASLSRDTSRNCWTSAGND